MQSSSHIGKIVRQHAVAVEHGKSVSRKQKTSAGKSSSFTSVPKHRAFVPMVTIWGGLLLALMTAVMPDQAIARVSSLTGVYLPLLLTRVILSLAIGLAGALLGYIVASALSNRAKIMDGDGVLVSAFKSRDVQPISPVDDLGSESLDAPLEIPIALDLGESAEFSEIDDASEREPNLGELAQRGYDIEAPEGSGGEEGRHKKGEWAFTRKHFKEALIVSCEGATCEAAHGAEAEFQPNAAPMPNTAQTSAPQGRPSTPRSLDLNEFASLPGRNGVWVEDQAETRSPQAQDTQVPEIGTPESAPESALHKLREKPAENLSLVEMVERFAGALHDHQAQERARAADSEIAREAALAEALKALALFTQRGFDQSAPARSNDNVLGQTEDELRSALARLQDVRGAA